MKNFYLVWRHCLLMVLGCFICLSGFAQLTQGKVYRFDNVGYAGYSLAATSTKAATAQTTNADAKSQMWYVSDTKTENDVTSYRLRNVGNGYYLQGAVASTAWAFVDGSVSEKVYLYLRSITSGGNTYYTLSVTNEDGGRNKMHCDGSKNIVGWSFTDNNHTQWTITEVTMTSEELTENWNVLENVNWTEERLTTAQGYLDALFTDKACTELKDTYKAMSQEQLQANTNYVNLPPTLQTMVLKTWQTQTTATTPQTVGEAWGEAHYSSSEDLAWDGEYAKRFRVQLYEPYSERDCTNAGLRINPHTNLNNPTGIIGKEREALYVMVGGDIQEGASLYLGAYSGHGQGGAYNDGVALHKGLNVVPIWADKQWTCIYYTVPTLQNYTAGENIAGSNKRYDITTFPDLKIHIEGGCVNGYYNAVGDDLWAHNAATTGCDEGRELDGGIATTLTKADGTTTPTNDNLLQTNNVYPKGDNEADWDYIAARNVLDDLTILGRYMVFQFCFNSPEDSKPQYSTNYWFTKLDGTRRVNICDWLERWDRIMMSERLMMGLLSEQEVTEANARYHAWNAAFGSIPENHDIFRYTGNDTDNPYACNYSNYYRMHGLGITMNNGYMSGGWNSSNYHYKTLADIIGKMTDETSTGGVCWGPGHEIGHQHQAPLNMRGLTEVSNNFFSNVAVWYDGRGTSRTAEGQGDLSNVLNAYSQDGNDFYTNNIWAQTQMYYKLWLYYHLVGHNTAFAPTLVEMLRQDPMVIQYNQAGATSLLHFYKKACDAAQEDLTDFFRAYGFLEVMDHRYVGDYSSAEYTQTQEDIDAAIAYVKAKGYPENVEILFINDYTTGETYVKHDGTTARRLWDGNTYSDLGSFQAYESGSAATGTYTMTAANGQVTMSGATGGVGFIVRDAKGNLLAFSSDYTFPVNDATMAAISTGTAVLQSVAADGSVTEITYDGSSAAISLLSGLLTTVKTLLDGETDNGGDDGESYTTPGLYKSNNAHFTALADKYTEAKEIYDNGNVAQYLAAYTALKDCYDALLADEYATIALQPGSKYIIRCKGRNQTYMYLNSETSGETTTHKVAYTDTLPESTAENYNAFLWSVEETGTAGKYYLKNASGENLYVLTVSAKQNEQFQCGSEKYAFGIQQVATGSNYFTFYHSSDPSTYMNAGNYGQVVSWDGANDNNSQWAFTLVEADATAKARILLEEMEGNTRTLLESMATMGVKGPLDMSTFRISSNSVEQGHGTELLVDGDASTYFHSNWSESSASSNLDEDHYLQIDCGEGNDLEQFQFNYITLPSSAGNLDAPASIDVYVGNTVDGDGNVTDFTKITTLSKDDANNPLPCISRAQSYTSPVIGTAGSPYRYIRLTVKNATKDNAVTNGTLNGHHWFGLAELGLSRASSKLFASDSRYTTITDAQYVTAANALGDAAVCLANANATASELTAAYDALSAQYTILLDAYNAAENADLTAAREALQSVINQTQSLLDECESISQSEESVALQCGDANGAYYISSNADQNTGAGNQDGGGVAALLDTDLTTYFHSRWGGTVVNEDHYLQVDMGSEDALTDFTFGYTVRQNARPNDNSPHPTIIEVYGSNDGEDFSTLLGTFKRTDAINPLPAYTESGASWTSTKIKSATPYRYVRFVVTESNGPGTKIYGGHYFFAMGTFSLTKIETKVTLSENCGLATEQDLLDTDDALQSAIATKSLATTVDQLTAAQTALQAQYEALLAAKTVVEGRETLKTVIDNATALKNSCYETDVQGNTVVKADYISNPNFSLEDLQNLERAISTAITVFRNAAATDDKVAAQETALAAAMAQLNRSFDYMALPITLTTDTNTPVLYTIYFQRDDTSYYLQYRGDESHGDSRDQYDYNKLKYNATLDRGNIYQAFYFTKSDVSGRLKMYAAADNKVFSVITGDLGAGAGKVKAFAADEANQTFDAREWTISANANNEGWFNIAPAPNAGTPLYLHNWNGITENPDNIGFDTDADNPGSLFKFASYQEADKIALNRALETLNTAYAACFSDPECTIIKSEYEGSLNLTRENLNSVKAVIDAAQAVSEDDLAYQSSVDEQTALVEAQTLVLQNLVAYAALPVKLTTDPAAPHYYRIYVNRSGRPLWQARTTDDPSSTKVQLTTAYDLGIDRQAWYFTAASEAPKLYIVNKNTTDRVLACTTGDFAVGAGKLQSLAVDYASVGANEWTITNEASQSGWYNITTVKTTTAQDGSTTNTTFYISNHGGVNNNMGFYNDSSDGGSNFQFKEIDPTRSAAYNTLYNYFHDETKVEIDMTAEPPAFPADKIHDTAIGYYNSSLASDYLSAYGNAYYALKFADYYNDEQFTTFYNTLVQYNEALVPNAIDFDAYYVLRNAHTGYCNNAVAYANVNDHKVYWHAQKNKVETTYTVDLNNGSDNKEASATYWTQWTSTATPSVTFSVGSKNIETSESNLVIYSGRTNAPFKLNAPTGYVIDSYSVTFANNGHDVAQTLTFSDEGVAYQTTRAAQTYTVANSGKSSVTITLTGTNQGVKLTNFTVKIRPSFTENEAVNVWKFEQVGNNAYLKNLHTGTYLTNAGTQYGARQLSTTGQPVTFNILGDGQLNIKVNGSQMHAQNDGSAVVAYPGGKNTASAWYVEKVAAPEEITTRINMTQYQKASLYLAYPAIIPDGITAYYAAREADATIEGTSGGSIYLTPFEGDVLPAGTPVILKGAQGAYKFDLSTTDEGTSPASNLFQGSAYKKLVQGETNYKYYLFGVKTVNDEKKVGLYWALLEYCADGTTSYTRDTGEVDGEGNAITERVSTAGTDNGGYFYVPANKIYLPWNTANGAAPAFYFNFDGTTTGVDGIENVWDRNTGIYDLQGRRVNRIEQSGIYVINGQKRFVKVNGR